MRQHNGRSFYVISDGLTQDNKMGVRPRAALLGILTAFALQQCLCIRPKLGNREDKVIGWSEKCVQECPVTLYRHNEFSLERFLEE